MATLLIKHKKGFVFVGLCKEKRLALYR
jgi:hypothetical protein